MLRTVAPTSSVVATAAAHAAASPPPEALLLPRSSVSPSSFSVGASATSGAVSGGKTLRALGERGDNDALRPVRAAAALACSDSDATNSTIVRKVRFASIAYRCESEFTAIARRLCRRSSSAYAAG